jgi:glycosyltransferase involved in cell wall biosynthesis
MWEQACTSPLERWELLRLRTGSWDTVSFMVPQSARSKVRIAFLQKAPSGHSDSCLRALAETGRAELFVTLPSTLADSPFEADEPHWIDHLHRISDLRSSCDLLDAVRAFRPDLLLVVGWEQRVYRQVARALRGETRRVVCMDNQYRGTLKQRAGVLGSRFYLHPYFDGAFVAGARQRLFAQMLGFEDDEIVDGFYSCDVDAFTAVPPLDASQHLLRRKFLYVGRLSPEKGIEVLRSAYEAYRGRHEEPWELVVVGSGPLTGLLEDQPGVTMAGFVQPGELPGLFAGASCLTLPSNREPWGVVVHEAAAAGLGVICTTAVGSGDVFVEENVNGRCISPGDSDALTAAMSWFHHLGGQEWAAVSQASRLLSRAISPATWASRVLAMGMSPHSEPGQSVGAGPT